MLVNGKPWRTIWAEDGGQAFGVIDQTRLPHLFETLTIRTLDEAAHAISAMIVRGAPLIGATAAWGMVLGMKEDSSDAGLENAYQVLLATRPTAVNLRWALDEVRAVLAPLSPDARFDAARIKAEAICDEDVALNDAIGENGLAIIRNLLPKAPKNRPFQILTHCNAGWLATVDWGTALAPIYKAFDAGIDLHVWVDETRPRNQGANLTAWELNSHGVPHTVLADNAGGHYMQHGMVDMVIVGSDRTTARGDVCNKIGTYLKALAAHDNGVPFYVGLPSPTIDWTLDDGVREIPIEERSQDEVRRIWGKLDSGDFGWVTLTPEGSAAGNPGFDVTPARLVTGLITERGTCPATREGLAALFPEHART